MKRKFSVSLTLALILSMIVSSLALADNIQNDVIAGGNDSIFIGGFTTVSYRVAQNNGDGENGCNATTSSPATVTINVPTDVTVDTDSSTAGNQNTLTFTACGVYQPVVFTASASGDFETTVSVSDSGPGTYNTNPAKFTLHVSAPTDSTPPTITPNVSGTLGNNGWYVSDVTVNWTVTDAESTVTSTSGCSPTTINSDTVGTTLTCTATSAGGTASQSVTIKRDATPPMISGSASPAPNGAGWNNTDVSVSFSCSDALSGIASCGPNQTLGGEGAGQSASGTAVDNAGNSATKTLSGINIDKTAPITSVSASPPPNANGWNNSDVTISFIGSDALSGIASCSAPVVLSSEGAGQSASGTCTDLAGNVSAPATASGINIDKTAPAITAIVPPANSYGWYNTSVTVGFNCSDALSGVNSCEPAYIFGGEGAGQFYMGAVTDKAGNTGSVLVSGINIDMTPPIISGSASPAPNAAGWNNTDVTVSFTCNDSLSDIASCNGPIVLNTDGADQSATGSAVDKAGNSASTTVAGIDIDKTPPSISWIGNINDGDTFYFGFVPPNPVCEAIDSLSGPGGCVVTGYESTIGNHTLVATANDVAGNKTIESRDYEVLAWTLNGFYKPVDMSGLIPVWNTVKGGSTVPLKFEVFAGLMELTDTSYISGFNATPVSCSLGLADAIEVTATGGTSLRYDPVAGQFIYNWQTPKSPGSCYKITMTTLDGSSLSALFKLK